MYQGSFEPRQAGGPPPTTGGTSSPSRSHPPLFTQYLPTGLTVQEDWSDPLRRRIAGAIGAVALVLFLAGLHCLFAGSHGLLWIGLSRLSRVAADCGVPGTYLLAAFEHLLGALALAWLALCLSFGAAGRIVPQASQRITYHRRQMLQAWSGLFLGGGGLLLLGAVLAVYRHPILAGLIEIPGWALFGAAVHRALLPETRIAVSCLGDLNRGWANQLLISGGPYNKGSVIIPHGDFIAAGVVAVGWQRVLNCADLRLVWRDSRGVERALLIPGAGTPAELQTLANYLQGGFTLSLDRPTIRAARPPLFRPDQL